MKPIKSQFILQYPKLYKSRYGSNRYQCKVKQIFICIFGGWYIVKDMGRFYDKMMGRGFLVQQLSITEIVGAYKKSFLGLTWMFVLPLLAVVIWVFLNGAGIIDPGDTGMPYPAYVLLSTSIWGFYLEAYKSTSNLLVTNGRMLIMAKVPFEPFITQKIVVHLINFIIPFLLNVIVLLFFGIRFSWWSLLFPLALVPLFCLGLAIGMFTAILRIIAVDLGTIIDEGMKLMMFLTPVVYTANVSAGYLQSIVRYNPLTYLVGLPRDVLVSGHINHIWATVVCASVSIFIFFVTYRMLIKVGRRVLERLVNN